MNVKKIISVLLFVIISMCAFSAVHVRGYYRSNGTYVQPHYRSNPNGAVLDNWSTKGNINPYTGKKGTKNSYPNYNVNPSTQYHLNSYEYSSPTINQPLKSVSPKILPAENPSQGHTTPKNKGWIIYY